VGSKRTHTHTATLSHSNMDRLIHPYAAYPHPDGNRYARDGHRYPICNNYHTNSNRHAFAFPNSNALAITHRNGYTASNSNANANTIAYALGDTDQHTHTHTHALTCAPGL